MDNKEKTHAFHEAMNDHRSAFAELCLRKFTSGEQLFDRFKDMDDGEVQAVLDKSTRTLSSMVFPFVPGKWMSR